MVYADEQTLWIYQGSTGRIRLAETTHQSGTVNEYPVVVDVDGDGEFRAGRDGVDFDGDGQVEQNEILRVLFATDVQDTSVVNEAEQLRPERDWLFLDRNQDRARAECCALCVRECDSCAREVTGESVWAVALAPPSLLVWPSRPSFCASSPSFSPRRLHVRFRTVSHVPGQVVTGSRIVADRRVPFVLGRDREEGEQADGTQPNR